MPEIENGAVENCGINQARQLDSTAIAQMRPVEFASKPERRAQMEFWSRYIWLAFALVTVLAILDWFGGW